MDWITQAEDIEPEGEDQQSQDQGNNNQNDTASIDHIEEIQQESWFKRKKKDFEKNNRKMRKICRKAVKSQTFYWLIIILVFLNTGVLASEHYNQPHWLDEFQGNNRYYLIFRAHLNNYAVFLAEYTNTFFITLFTMEMFLKMYSLGFQVNLSLLNFVSVSIV